MRPIAALVLFVCVLPGCFSSRPAMEVRTQPAQALPAEHWPARDPRAVQAIMDDTPHTVHSLRLADGVDPASLDDATRAQLDTPEFQVTTNRVIADGLFRTWERSGAQAQHFASLERLIAQLSGGFAPNASYLSSRTVQDERWSTWLASRRESIEAANILRRQSGSPTLLTGSEDLLGLRSGVEIELPPANARAERGLVLHFQALIPNEYERAITDRLRADGWAIASFDTLSTVPAPRDPALLATLPELKRRQAENSRALFPARPAPKPAPEEAKRLSAEAMRLAGQIARIERGEYTCCDIAGADALGETIATAVDNTLAENAFAAQAALEFLESQRPELATRPVVVLGFSAGALVAPAVAARLGERVAAAVIVAGGADLLDISCRTDLTGVGFPIRCAGETAAPEVLEAIRRSHQRHTKLDPLVTAPLLARTPVLLILAGKDTTVPCACGERLDELLGRPDRIDFSGDHMELFYFLPREKNRIARWVGEHARGK